MHVSGSRTRPSPVHFKLRVEVSGLSAVGMKAVVGVEFKFYVALSGTLLYGYTARMHAFSVWYREIKAKVLGIMRVALKLTAQLLLYYYE